MILDGLRAARRLPFGTWSLSKGAIPSRPGVYLIYDTRDKSLLYVGIAGDGDGGLLGRISQHERGDRAQSHFCTYLFDFLVLPTLNMAEHADRLRKKRTYLNDLV